MSDGPSIYRRIAILEARVQGLDEVFSVELSNLGHSVNRHEKRLKKLEAAKRVRKRTKKRA